MLRADDRVRLPIARAGLLLDDRRALGDVRSVRDRAAAEAVVALPVRLLSTSAQMQAGSPPASRSARTCRQIHSRPAVGSPSLRRRPETCSGLQPGSGFSSTRLHCSGPVLRGFDEAAERCLAASSLARFEQQDTPSPLRAVSRSIIERCRP